MIYGEVDVHELYDAPAEIRALARERVGMLAPRAAMDTTGSETVLSGVPWGQFVGACPGQPMMDQISAGYCTVTLVAPDLAATAYHCLGWLDCDEVAVVRGYHYRAESELQPLDPATDVRRCSEYVTPALAPGEPPPEIGWIRLSAPFAPFATTLPLGDATLGTRVVSLAHVGGVPLKFLDAARVYDEYVEQGARVLVTNLDSFHGASGSPVLNDSGELTALIAGGAPDFLPTDAECLDLNTAPDELAEERAIAYGDVRLGACLAPDDLACETASDGEGPSSGCSIARSHLDSPYPWVALAALLAMQGSRVRQRRRLDLARRCSSSSGPLIGVQPQSSREPLWLR